MFEEKQTWRQSKSKSMPLPHFPPLIEIKFFTSLSKANAGLLLPVSSHAC